LCDFHAVAVVCGFLDVEVAAGCGEDGRDEFVVCFYGAALSAKGVDEHFDSFAALRCAVCARQELLYPGFC
jgi:hypothetical protein